MEYNECSTQKDPNSSCLDSRSDAVIVRYNTVFNNVGAAVRIGGHTINGHTFGQNNEVYGNTFKNNGAGALKVQTGPHKPSTFCENKCEGTCEVGGSVVKDYSDIESKCSGVMDIFWVDGTEAEPAPKPEDKGDETGEPEETGETEDPGKDHGAKVAIQTNAVRDSKCFAVTIADIEASSAEGRNTARSAVDGKALTRWSARGKDAWLEVDFGKPVEINAVEIAFFKGDSRTQEFDVFVEGKAVLEKQESSGKTLSMQKFPFEATTGSSVTIMGRGNSENDWNSLTEMVVCGTSEQSKEEDASGDDRGSAQCETIRKLELSKISATSNDGGDKVENVLDGNLKTYWSADGPDQQEILMVLEEPSFVLDIGIAVHNGDKRQLFFDVLAFNEHGWAEIVIDGSSKRGVGIESYDMGIENVQRVKIVFYGYKEFDSDKKGTWNSVTEVELYGC